jgi:hypothetical protein
MDSALLAVARSPPPRVSCRLVRPAACVLEGTKTSHAAGRAGGGLLLLLPAVHPRSAQVAVQLLALALVVALALREKAQCSAAVE